MSEFSRRQVLKGVFAAGATTMAASALATTKERSWDETVDVVVIGSGFAGLAAAIEAKKAGGNVVVLEKMPTPGGNSIINGGIMSAPGCPQQIKHGIKDSKRLFEKDILRAGNYMNDPKKVRYVVDHALSNYEWTIQELGVEYMPDAIGQEGGHSVPRHVTLKNGSGSGIVQKELEKVKALGVPVRLRTYVERIVRNEDGRVEGVVVRKNYKFPDATSGKVVRIRATKGVIACYGGFAADLKYRTYQDPKLTDKLDTTNQPGATSELWRETSAIGALQVQNDWIQCGPWGSPREKGMGIASSFNQGAAAEYGIWVNSDGKRFVNELANRKVRSDAIMAEQAQGKKCIAICNEANLNFLRAKRPSRVEELLERKIVEKFDTLEEMAKAAGVNYRNLKAEIEEFNGFVKAKKDPKWGHYINNDQLPSTEGPWYYSDLQPKIHHCMGGLVTDENCQVLDVRTYQPIPGFYAAGESCGMVHGAVRLGSVATLECLVFGRLAGQQVMKA